MNVRQCVLAASLMQDSFVADLLPNLGFITQIAILLLKRLVVGTEERLSYMSTQISVLVVMILDSIGADASSGSSNCLDGHLDYLAKYFSIEDASILRQTRIIPECPY